MLLCDEALRFIFYHELAHVMHGHLGYLEEVSGNSTMTDFDTAPQVLDPLTRQTLEMDADSVAVSHGLSHMLRCMNQAHGGRAEFRTPQALMFIWSFAIYLLFRHRAAGGPIFERIDEFSHTPPQLRALQAHLTLNSCLSARRDGTSTVAFTPNVETLIEATPATAEALAIAELALADLRRDLVDKVPLMQALSEEAHHLMLREQPRAWASIRSKLEPHAFSGLAPGLLHP